MFQDKTLGVLTFISSRAWSRQNIDEAGEVTSAFGVARRDGTVALEPVEEALNAVALGVQGEVRRARPFDTDA
jgi:hypothetical protein